MSFNIFHVEVKVITSDSKELKVTRNKEYEVRLNSLKSPDGNKLDRVVRMDLIRPNQ